MAIAKMPQHAVLQLECTTMGLLHLRKCKKTKTQPDQIVNQQQCCNSTQLNENKSTPQTLLIGSICSLLQQVINHENHLRNTHTHPFNSPFSGITQVSQYQKGKTNMDFTFTKATDSEWQWHQLGHMQVCTSLQTDNHTSTPPLSFYRPDALPAAQPTASKH